MAHRARVSFRAAALVAVVSACSGHPPPSEPAAALEPHTASEPFHEQRLSFERFARIDLLVPSTAPRQVVLLLSGEAGFEREARSLGEALAASGIAVAGIDLRPYAARNRRRRPNGECMFLSEDFQALARRIEKILSFPSYAEPALVGYRDGSATIVASLAESPSGIFRGAVTIDFSPALDLGVAACGGHGEVSWEADPKQGTGHLAPPAGLPDPWIDIEDGERGAHETEQATAFVARTPHARAVPLDGAARAAEPPSVPVRQVESALIALDESAPTGSPSSNSLPSTLGLVEMPATRESADSLAIELSGDGGWGGLDEQLTADLVRMGVPVVGWNSLRYFWSMRSEEEVALDLERIARHYLATWRKQRVLLVGYSFGADVMASVAYRLPRDLRERVRVLALVGPSGEVALGPPGAGPPVAVLPELGQLRGPALLCFEGKSERTSLCPSLPSTSARVVEFDGGHAFAGDFETMARTIVDAAH